MTLRIDRKINDDLSGEGSKGRKEGRTQERERGKARQSTGLQGDCLRDGVM